MKRIHLLIFIGLLVGPRAFADDLDMLVRQGNAYYMEEEYEKAVEVYESVLDSGYASSELYFNLGNAYYKSHDITMALVNYERAHILDPKDEEILHNLRLAREFVVDRIEVLPEFFLLTWFRGFVKTMDSDHWALISIASFIGALGLMLLYVFSLRVNLKKTSFWLAVFLLFISISSLVFAAEHKRMVTKHNLAIILTPSVTIKSSPDERSGTDLFLLHEGTRVRVEDELGEWCEVVLTDGNRGWLKESDLIRL